MKEETQQKETAETPYRMTVDTKRLWPTRNTLSNKREVPYQESEHIATRGGEVNITGKYNK